MLLASILFPLSCSFPSSNKAKLSFSHTRTFPFCYIELHTSFPFPHHVKFSASGTNIQNGFWGRKSFVCSFNENVFSLINLQQQQQERMKNRCEKEEEEEEEGSAHARSSSTIAFVSLPHASP